MDWNVKKIWIWQGFDRHIYDLVSVIVPTTQTAIQEAADCIYVATQYKSKKDIIR